MGRKRFAPEKIIGMLREAEIALSQGMTVGEVSRQLSISEQTDYRWRKQYGGMKVSQAKRLQDLEREKSRLKKAVADLTLDKLILHVALEGNYEAPTVAVYALRTFGVGWGYLKEGHARYSDTPDPPIGMNPS